MEDTTTTTSRSSSNNSNIPTQRQTLWQWIVMRGKNISSISKEDKFIWQPLSSYRDNSREEILYAPNNQHHLDDQWVENVLLKSRIRGRKDWIDFILTSSYNGHADDEQQQKQNNLQEETTSPIQKQISIIETYYKERRMEVRNLSNIYIANSRHRHQNDLFPPQPLVVGDGDQHTVQIDRHGRFVRSRQDGTNHDNNNDDDDNGDNNNEIVELIDAADIFWKKHKQKKPLQQPPPQVLPPPLPNPLNEQQIRERNMSQRMENESRQAIARGIHRYRRQQQQQQEGDEAIFELVHIPLMPQRNDVNVPRWLRFLSLNRQQRQGQQQELGDDNIPHHRQQQNHHPHELQQHQHQQQQRNQHHNHHNGENWIDFRLALRRICFAVITVVAAFLCMMLQGLPTYVDFGDDEYYGMMDMDTIFLSGLLGPYAHYPGQHHQRQQQQQQQQPRNEWTYEDLALGEDGQNDIQQSIWNRLLLEDAVFDQGHHHDDDGSMEEL